MVRVVQRGRFSVYVYDERGERHHRPHCHVLWSDGEASVDLRTLDVLAGDALPALARRLVEDHEADITAAWDRLNPRRTRR
jgi:hypothetical protein